MHATAALLLCALSLAPGSGAAADGARHTGDDDGGSDGDDGDDGPGGALVAGAGGAAGSALGFVVGAAGAVGVVASMQPQAGRNEAAAAVLVSAGALAAGAGSGLSFAVSELDVAGGVLVGLATVAGSAAAGTVGVVAGASVGRGMGKGANPGGPFEQDEFLEAVGGVAGGAAGLLVGGTLTPLALGALLSGGTGDGE